MKYHHLSAGTLWAAYRSVWNISIVLALWGTIGRISSSERVLANHAEP